MENLVKKVNSQTTAIIALVLIVLSVFAVLVFKLNLGPDFRSSQVVIAQLDHEANTDNITAIANAILKPAQVQKESTGKFYFYFQNVSAEQLAQFITSFKLAEPGTVSTQTMNVAYAGELFIGERVIVVSILGLIAFFIYIAWAFKQFDFKRSAIGQFLASELIIISFSALVLGGVGSVLGKLGVSMDVIYWDIFLLGLAIVLIFRVYSVFRLRDYARKEQPKDFAELYKKMYQKYWPEFVFILCLGVIVALLPWLVASMHLLTSSVIILFALALSFFNFALLEPHFLRFSSDWGVSGTKKTNKARNSNSFWDKKW